MYVPDSDQSGFYSLYFQLFLIQLGNVRHFNKVKNSITTEGGYTQSQYTSVRREASVSSMRQSVMPTAPICVVWGISLLETSSYSGSQCV